MAPLLLPSPPKLPYLHLGLLLLVATPIATTAEPLFQICSSFGTNYTANSTFGSNLHRLLSSLAANGSATGFFHDTTGNAPDRVYGIVLCRGDMAADDCRTCLDAAAQDILQTCPNSRSAVIWYDYCMLRYSNLRIISLPDDTLKIPMWNTGNLREVTQFNQQLDELMAGLVRYAAYNRSARMFATGEADYGVAATPKIYGLVQCTRDQSPNDCNICLKGILGEMPSWAFGKQGARYLKATCNFRYEVYPFFNSPVMVSVPLLTQAPSSPGTQGRIPTGTVLAIAIPLAAALVLISALCLCFRRRKSEEGKSCK